MSIPITTCLVVKAADGNETAYAEFKERMVINRRAKGFSVWGCNHQPPCETTRETLDALEARLAADLGEPVFPAARLSLTAVHENLAGTECLGCGGVKKKRQSFCRSCYFSLPKPLRGALYDPTHYVDTFNDALRLLKRDERAGVKAKAT